MTLRITLTVSYEIIDAMELRASAVAAEGEENWSAHDAAMRLLAADGLERLRLPGTRVTGMQMRREQGD